MDDQDESLDTEVSGEPTRPRHFGDFFKLLPSYDLEVRANNAFHASVRFLEMLQSEVKDPEWQQTLLRAWLNSVKNRNYSRFQREYRRWKRHLVGDTPTDNETTG